MTEFLNVVLKDGDKKMYRPEWRQFCGSITATVLLSQIVYWWNKNNRNKFYKFKQPCEHDFYREGDSWCEELGFGEKEFELAIKQIGFKRGSAPQGQIPKSESEALVIYYTDKTRKTFYELNEDLLEEHLKEVYLSKGQKGLYLVKDKRDFTSTISKTTSYINIKKNSKLEKEENNEEKTNNEREINNLPYKKEEVINKQVVEEEPDCLSNSGDAQSFLAKKARNAVKRKLKQEYGGVIPPFVNQEEEIKKAGVPSTPSLTVTQTYQVPKSQEFADLLKWMREIKRPASFLPETEDNFLRIRQTFQLAEIKAAIKIALLDDFWKNQFNLNTFLRPSNYKGQPQDNVATFYSRRADNDPRIFAIKQEMKEELEKLAELENNAD